MFKIFLIFLCLSILLSVGAFFLCMKIVDKATHEVVKSYETPDTTIIYKNGRWDTTIQIKQAPNWLKK